jgi:hypothetical protein
VYYAAPRKMGISGLEHVRRAGRARSPATFVGLGPRRDVAMAGQELATAELASTGSYAESGHTVPNSSLKDEVADRIEARESRTSGRKL